VTELRQAVTRNGLLLAAFALLTALLVAGTYLGTRDTIAAAQRAAEEKALLQIVPRDMHDNSMLDDHVTAQVGDPLLQLREARPIYRARRDGNVVAVIVPALAPDGYSGAIGLAVGVLRDGSIAGVRVLSHRETPGLGDKIDRKNRTGSMASSASRSRRRPHDPGAYVAMAVSSTSSRARRSRRAPWWRRRAGPWSTSPATVQPCSNSRSHAMQDTRTAPGRWVNE
jgi:electron transport complex protein RnfG